MKVEIDRSRCQGHALCIARLPEVFKEDEQGNSYVESPAVPVQLESQVRRAALSCPEQAIIVTEEA